MCLIYCSALNLLQAIETEEQGRRTGRWNREEGKKVANLLGEKSLIKTSTFEGRVQVKVNNAIKKDAAILGEPNYLKHSESFCTVYRIEM